MGKGLSYLKNWGIGVSYCWNYGPSKLPLHFIEYRLDQLNSKYTKIAVSSAMQYSEGFSQKRCLLKVWSFWFIHHPPCKVFAKLNRNYLLRANIFKLQEYHTFGLMKFHMCKIWFANNTFSLLRWNKNFSWFFKGFQLPEIVQHL